MLVPFLIFTLSFIFVSVFTGFSFFSPQTQLLIIAVWSHVWKKHSTTGSHNSLKPETLKLSSLKDCSKPNTHIYYHITATDHFLPPLRVQSSKKSVVSCHVALTRKKCQQFDLKDSTSLYVRSRAINWSEIPESQGDARFICPLDAREQDLFTSRPSYPQTFTK